jgi:hypothetical protein
MTEHVEITKGQHRWQGEGAGVTMSYLSNVVYYHHFLALPRANTVCGRAASTGAPCGREAHLEGCGAQTGGRRPASVRVYGGAQRCGGALWSAGRGGARDVASSGTTRCSAGYFDHDLLPNLNWSAPRSKKQSCRSHYPLQLLQWLYSVFLNGFCINCCQTLNATIFQWTGAVAVDLILHPFPLKIWNAIQHESCVPRKTG